MTANQALAREQLALIDEVLAIEHQGARDGKIARFDPSFSLWERRRLETLRKTGAGKAEMVAALEKFLNNLKDEEAIAKAHYESARISRVELYDLQFRRMEAEIWLNDEKAR